MHIFKKPEANYILLPGVNKKVKQVTVLGTTQNIKYKKTKEGLSILINDVDMQGPDTIVLVEFK